MRFSQVKTTTLFLLGLSSFLLGGNASPTGIYEVEDRSVIYENQKLAARAKDPLKKFKSLGYIIEDNGFALPGKPKLYVVKRKGIINQLDQIKVDATEKSIDLELANNKNSDTGPDKLKLSDIMMAVYVEKTKQKPEDLAIVRFVRITEDGTNKAIRDAKKKLGLGDLEKFDVSSDSDGKKEEIFEDLKNTALGKAAEWLHKDFDTGKIEKIFVTDGVEQGTMTIHFDD